MTISTRPFYWSLNAQKTSLSAPFRSPDPFTELQLAQNDLEETIDALEKKGWKVVSKRCGTYDEVFGKNGENGE